MGHVGWTSRFRGDGLIIPRPIRLTGYSMAAGGTDPAPLASMPIVVNRSSDEPLEAAPGGPPVRRLVCCPWVSADAGDKLWNRTGPTPTCWNPSATAAGADAVSTPP